jgi:GT2 family glycosyltransferase
MNDPNKTAVVILNWNGKHYLESFLPGVWAHTHAHARVVVADNGSEDGSADFVRNIFPESPSSSWTATMGLPKGIIRL